MRDDRLEVLLQSYLDQLLTADERSELEQMLLASAQAREQFWEAARWNGMLRQWGESEWGRRDAENRTLISLPKMPATISARPSLRRWFPRLGLALAAAVAVLLASFLGYHQWLNHNRKPATVNGIAVITRISDAAWSENGQLFQVGESLNTGPLRLDRGAVQIEFSSGARVVLEGPAEFQLISQNEAFLRRGKMSAHVPRPARGFKIGTAEFSVVDHGTEFGCIVDSAGAGEVHVFAGSVSWNADDKSAPRHQELKKNQALRISHQLPQPIPADRSAFLSEDELARLDALRVQLRMAEWRESRASLRDDPAAVVYFDFERRGQDRIFRNTAANAPADSDASIIGSDPTDGRWPGKSAVEFKRPGDRLRLTVPGAFPALTLLAWIRVDSLPNRQESLAMSESFEVGEMHWYIFRDRSVALGVHTNTPQTMHGWRIYNSPPLFNQQDFGTWRLVTSTCDTTTGVVEHYLDGRLVGRVTHGGTVPLRPGTFEIGNWGVRPDDPRLTPTDWGKPQDAIRNFHGRMDEFAILSRTLSAADIQKIYRAGRPGEAILTPVDVANR